MDAPRTIAEASRQPVHRSFFLRRVRALAGGENLHSWLIAQANARGFRGAYVTGEFGVASSETLSLEDIVVGLTGPWAEVDGRTLKLVLRILQSDSIDTQRLAALAKQERADVALHWLLELTPDSERTEPVERIARAIGTPRGYRGVTYDLEALLRELRA